MIQRRNRKYFLVFGNKAVKVTKKFYEYYVRGLGMNNKPE